MFSKRHYDAIAETIASNKLVGNATVVRWSRVGRHKLILEMINMFERDNPKFDRVKFIDACGLAIDKPEIVEVQL